MAAGVQARRLLAAGSLIATVAIGGCGGGSDESTTSTAAETTTAESTTTQAPAPPSDQPAEGANAGEAELYFTAGEQFRTVERRLPEGGGELEAATEALVAGPAEGDHAETQIPADVKVNGVDLAGDGTATVEVSANFLDGIPARAADRDDLQRQELAARLGQLTYTLTQFDDVDAVKVVAGGEPVEEEAERSDFAAPAKGPQRKARPKGPQSSSTRRLQERLADLQYLPRSAVDGVQGYRTQQAVIAFQSWEGLERDGVVGPATTAALAMAKAPRPKAGGPSRRIEVYRDRGVALLIAHGRTKRAVHVSTGAPGTSTPAGTFKVFRKELRSWSVPFQVWLPYASYFNNGIAFHEYPDVPVYPASHGCVRVPAPEAEGLYRFAKIDTTVVVI
ncbi:MAG: GerMN domain-containing protein [Vicinamibacteria bacterium]|jgi:lipoprotein-anchoring transpeptidase ErfK/SrfK